MVKGTATWFKVFLILLVTGTVASCQKDQQIKDTDTLLSADSTVLTASDNVLAVKGTLKITLLDSTYSFDALRDSIAFVSVHAGNDQYFGITAINKDHNMSFGLSSPGYALGNTDNVIAGGQFILRPDKSAPLSYALTNNKTVEDFGKLVLTSYKQDSVLAKGTFYTYLASDTGKASVFYKVKGTFSLQLK